MTYLRTLYQGIQCHKRLAVWFTAPLNDFHYPLITRGYWLISYQDIYPFATGRFVFQDRHRSPYIFQFLHLVQGKTPRATVDDLPSLVSAIIKSAWLKATVGIEKWCICFLVTPDDVLLKIYWQ